MRLVDTIRPQQLRGVEVIEGGTVATSASITVEDKILII